MKKVICVDAGDNIRIITGEEYIVLQEDDGHYLIDIKGEGSTWYKKSCFRPVPEAEYQYGQEVEFKHGNEWIKGHYIGKTILHGGKHIIEVCDTVHSCLLFNDSEHIRPVQLMRERVIQELHSANSFEVIADRIIELVKNENI